MRADIEFMLTGDVNGQRFEMNGIGVGDSETGTCELHLKADPKFPAGFDPVSCPLICSHPTSTFFARQLADQAFPGLLEGAYDVSPSREGVVRDAAGEELLRLNVTGSSVFDGKLRTHNVMRGVSRMPELLRNVTPLKDYILPSGPGRATALVRYQLETKDNQILDGVTTVPYKWNSACELANPLVRQVEMIDVQWDGNRTVSAYYRLSISALKEVATGRIGVVSTGQAA